MLRYVNMLPKTDCKRRFNPAHRAEKTEKVIYIQIKLYQRTSPVELTSSPAA